MGYTTDFTGILKFTSEITGPQLAKLNEYLGRDRREIGFTGDGIYENGKYGSYWYHIDLEISEDFSGIQWNGCEKTYDLEHIVNWLIDQMRKEYPDFGLSGELLAQGEDYEDRWRLVMKDGRAVKIDMPRIGDKVTCPHCECEFTLEN